MHYYVITLREPLFLRKQPKNNLEKFFEGIEGDSTSSHVTGREAVVHDVIILGESAMTHRT